ncbi:hypothetical protein [Trichormus sp. NMC-1]|nr:hypothetical protein [Trichormus sp. NMC-1]
MRLLIKSSDRILKIAAGNTRVWVKHTAEFRSQESGVRSIAESI